MEDRRIVSVINISDTLGYRLVGHFFVFFSNSEVICDLLLNRRTATWDLFVKFLIARRHFIKNLNFLIVRVRVKYFNIDDESFRLAFGVKQCVF